MINRQGGHGSCSIMNTTTHLNLFQLRRASDAKVYVIGMNDAGLANVYGPVVSYNQKSNSLHDKRPARLRIGNKTFTLGIDSQALGTDANIRMEPAWIKFLLDKNLVEAEAPDRISFYDPSAEPPPHVEMTLEPNWVREVAEWKKTIGRAVHISHVRLPRIFGIVTSMGDLSKILPILKASYNVTSKDSEVRAKSISDLLSPSPMGGITLAFAVSPVQNASKEESLYVRYGYSICSEKDLFNRKFGLDLAMKRLREFSEDQADLMHKKEDGAWYLDGNGDLLIQAPHSTVEKYGDHYEVASPSFHRLGMIRSSILRELTIAIIKKRREASGELRMPTTLLALLGATNDLDLLCSGYDPLDPKSWVEKTAKMNSDLSEQRVQEIKAGMFLTTLIKLLISQKEKAEAENRFSSLSSPSLFSLAESFAATKKEI